MLVVGLAIGVTAYLAPQAMAAECKEDPAKGVFCCGDVQTSVLTCEGVNNESTNAEDNAIWKILILILNILAVGVGIAAVGGIVYASILYTSARDNAAQTKQAKDIITNVIIGIVCYGLMYMGLNFLIPGGIFA